MTTFSGLLHNRHYTSIFHVEWQRNPLKCYLERENNADIILIKISRDTLLNPIVNSVLVLLVYDLLAASDTTDHLSSLKCFLALASWTHLPAFPPASQGALFPPQPLTIETSHSTGLEPLLLVISCCLMPSIC